jgi:hypothetical protein
MYFLRIISLAASYIAVSMIMKMEFGAKQGSAMIFGFAAASSVYWLFDKLDDKLAAKRKADPGDLASALREIRNSDEESS